MCWNHCNYYEQDEHRIPIHHVPNVALHVRGKDYRAGWLMSCVLLFVDHSSPDQDTIAFTEVQKLYGEFYEQCLQPALAQHADLDLPQTFAELKRSYWVDIPIVVKSHNLSAFGNSLADFCRASRQFRKVQFYMKVHPARQPWFSLSEGTTLPTYFNRCFRPMLPLEQEEWIVHLQWIFGANNYALHWSDEANDSALAIFCPSWSLEDCEGYLRNGKGKHVQPFPPLHTTSSFYCRLDQSGLPYDPTTDAISFSITRTTRSRPAAPQPYRFQSEDTLSPDTLTTMVSRLEYLGDELLRRCEGPTGELKIQVDVHSTMAASRTYHPDLDDGFLAGIRMFNPTDWW